MKTRVFERTQSNLLLLCASFVTVKNIVLNSYLSCEKWSIVSIPSSIAYIVRETIRNKNDSIKRKFKYP